MPAKILIVDDEYSARKTIENVLLGQDYVLEFAVNGAEGLARAIALQPDVVLCDVMMPEMDGLEFCRRVRAEPTIATVPIVLITALGERENKLQGLNAGADDFITKPIDGSELRARVRTTVRLNRYQQLVAERARLQWVFENSQDGYLIVSPTDQIEFANSRARLYLGLPADTDPTPLPGFLDAARRQYHLEPADAWQNWQAETNPAPRYLVRPETATAQSFWLQAQILALPTDAFLGRIILLQDVTTQMVNQRRWSSFAQTLAHKLRTPIVGIYSLLDALQADALTLPSSELMEMLALGFQSASRLRDQVDATLKYIEAPRAQNDFTPITVAKWVTLAQQLCQAASVPMTSTLAPETNSLALALSSQSAETILTALLDNAIKFHPAHEPQVTLQIQCQADQICARFCDNGIALSPEQIARAWTPFYQGEKYITGEAVGMGLGLATVAWHIWNVGGTCQMSNRNDHPGVCVELKIPIRK